MKYLGLGRLGENGISEKDMKEVKSWPMTLNKEVLFLGKREEQDQNSEGGVSVTDLYLRNNKSEYIRGRSGHKELDVAGPLGHYKDFSWY